MFLEELLARFPDYVADRRTGALAFDARAGRDAHARRVPVTSTVSDDRSPRRRRAAPTDDDTGLLFEGVSWTWAEVAHECAVRAAMLAATWEGVGDAAPFHVGVLLDNVPEYVFLLGGAALAGAPSSGSTRPGGAPSSRTTSATPTASWSSPTPHRPLLDGLDLGIDDDRIVTIESDTWRRSCAEHAAATIPAELPGPETLFVLIFTSGSTGAPKAVRMTQGRFASMGARMPFGPDDVLYCPMPLFHGNALNELRARADDRARRSRCGASSRRRGSSPTRSATA